MTSERPHEAGKSDVRRTVLPGGLTVLTERIPHVRSLTLGVWVLRGSRHEPASLGGIYHCLEHMLFKGTERHDAKTIARLIDSMGGHVNAFTGKENMCYYARVLDEFMPAAVDLLADIVLHPTFLEDELERERKVILEEIKMVEDTPDDLVHTLFVERFWSDHPLARPIHGTTDTVNAINSERLRQYFASEINGGSLLVAAAGSLDHAELAERLGAAFESVRPAADKPAPQPAPSPHTTQTYRSKRGLSQSYVCLGLPSFPRTHENRYPLGVLNGVLGTGVSSRLFQTIREDLGLAYDVYSDVVAYQDAGYLVVYAGTNAESLPKLIDAVRKECRTLKHELVPDEELRRAKGQIKSSILLGLESTFSRMSNITANEIDFGRQLSLDETLAKIEAVTSADVLGVAKQLFDAAPLSLTILGDSDDGAFSLDDMDLAC